VLGAYETMAERSRKETSVVWSEWKEKDYQSRRYMDTRSRGGQRKICLDNAREDLKEKNIDLTGIGEATRNIEFWKSLRRASSSAG